MWKCNVCNRHIPVSEKQFPLTCVCGQRYENINDKGDESKKSIVIKDKKPVIYQFPDGPGTELHLIFQSLGINPIEGCGCAGFVSQMNRWGVQGCINNREQILKWLKEGKSKYSWRDQFKAAVSASKTQLLFKCNPIDPFPGLLDEAISRSIIKQKEKDNAKS